MYDGVSFDELNRLYSENHKPQSLPYEQYFGEMELTPEQMERRINTAEQLEDAFLFALMVLFYMEQMGAVSYEDARSSLESQYRNILEAGDIPNSQAFLDTALPAAIASILSTTINNPENPFNFTEDRARLLAENGANAVWNDAEFEEALEAGYRNKMWHSIIDKHTRDTHREMDGVSIPLMEPFEVGEYLMMYPMDASLGAGDEEIANCRCSVEYF